MGYPLKLACYVICASSLIPLSSVFPSENKKERKEREYIYRTYIVDLKQVNVCTKPFRTAFNKC
jgi:hypothetical protein